MNYIIIFLINQLYSFLAQLIATSKTFCLVLELHDKVYEETKCAMDGGWRMDLEFDYVISSSDWLGSVSSWI